MFFSSAAVDHRTGSLLNSILAHNFWDGTAVASWFLLYWAPHRNFKQNRPTFSSVCNGGACPVLDPFS